MEQIWIMNYFHKIFYLFFWMTLCLYIEYLSISIMHNQSVHWDSAECSNGMFKWNVQVELWCRGMHSCCLVRSVFLTSLVHIHNYQPHRIRKPHIDPCVLWETFTSTVSGHCTVRLKPWATRSEGKKFSDQCTKSSLSPSIRQQHGSTSLNFLIRRLPKIRETWENREDGRDVNPNKKVGTRLPSTL